MIDFNTLSALKISLNPKMNWTELSHIHFGKALDLGEEFTSCVEQGEEVDTCTVRWEENQFHVARGSFKKQKYLDQLWYA